MLNATMTHCGCGYELSLVEQTSGHQQVPVWCSGMMDLNRWRLGMRTSHDIFSYSGRRLGKGLCQRKLQA